MRIFMLIPAVFAFATPAAAQGWKEYSYPDYSFAVTFPAEPQIQTTTYPVGGDRTVSARVYAVRRDDAEFKVTVADLGDPAPEEAAVIGNAIKTLSAGGEVKVNIPHRINRVFGRQLSIVMGDGSRTSLALFDYNGRLYQIEGKSLSAGGNATADAIRFVQSLAFTGGGSNRSADEQRGRFACNDQGGTAAANAGAAADVGGPGPEERRRFELRCQRQQLFAALRTSLEAGDLPGAQKAYASLSELPRFGNPNNPNNPANPNGPFAQAVNQIGQALQNSDLSGAQQALSLLRQRGRDGRGDRQDGGNRQP
jgi:hypothetical protein